MTFFVAILIILAVLIYITHQVAKYAEKIGLSYTPILVLGLISSPVIQYIVVLIMGSNLKKESKERDCYYNTKKCPFCAETIKKDAIFCRFCNRDINSKTIPKKNEELFEKYSRMSIEERKALCFECEGDESRQNCCVM